MAKLNRIVALIDFSVYTTKVIDLTKLLSSHLQCEVLYLHQVTVTAPALADEQSRKEIVEYQTANALGELKSVTHGTYAYTPRYVVTHLDLISVLEQQKDESYFDWVVVGLKGGGVLKQLFIGSVTSKIIDETSFMTIATPLVQHAHLPGELVLAVSPDYPYNTAQLHVLVKGLGTQIRQVTLVSVLKDSDDIEKAVANIKSLQQELTEVKTEVKVLEQASLLEALKDYLADKPDAYLVVQQGSRTLLDDVFRNYFINELIYNHSLPLIVISK